VSDRFDINSTCAGSSIPRGVFQLFAAGSCVVSRGNELE
jgi:hypothetical protein